MKKDTLLDLLRHKPVPEAEAAGPGAGTDTPPKANKGAQRAKKPDAMPRAGKRNSEAASSRPTNHEPVRGRGVHLWFHPEDEKNIRSIAGWLAAQRGRINDSLVIKCALRVVKLDQHLLDAYDEAVKIDGRKRERKVQNRRNAV